MARKLFEEHEKEWLEELLTPTRIYVRPIKKLIQENVEIHGMAHITGGGLRNLLRLGKHHYKLNPWKIPKIFEEIQKRGDVAPAEMYSTFNQGIGFVLIIPQHSVDRTLDILNQYYESWIAGTVEQGNFVSVGNLKIYPVRSENDDND